MGVDPHYPTRFRKSEETTMHDAWRTLAISAVQALRSRNHPGWLSALDHRLIAECDLLLDIEREDCDAA